MATAAFKLNTLAQERIDTENNVIFGVRLCEVGKLARFNGPDGKPREALITKEHANAFLAHAGNRSIPVHWTHDYLDDNKDRLHAKVGALKNFRLDNNGNPIADFYVAPSDYRETILWGAKEDPENMMLSAVFSYDPKDPKVMPLDLQAADLVECGAATTALFSQTKPTKTMLDTETKAEIQELIKAAFAEASKTEEPKAETEAEIAIAAASEAEAGVTDEDKKPEDDAKPAALRAALRIARATSRITKAALAANKDETVKLAEAQFTKAIGNGNFTLPAAQNDGDELDKALAAYTGVNRGTAIFKLAKDKPELYNKFRKEGKL